jgi:hypothetical protein
MPGNSFATGKFRQDFRRTHPVLGKQDQAMKPQVRHFGGYA